VGQASACHAPASHPPRGFTLVEVLVVVAILGMLMALLTPAVIRARSSAFNAKVKVEADMLHMALMNYKNEYGSFPPADFRRLWRTDVTPNRVDVTHPVYKHLVRIFPRISEYTQATTVSGVTYESPYRFLADLSPAQALVFWLQGFYPDQERPLTGGGVRKKLYDFEESRLYGVVNSPTSQGFASRNSVTGPGREFPVYFTGHSNAGLPYVYFDSRCYDNDPTALIPQPDTTWQFTSMSGVTSMARPYFTATPPSSPLWSQRHVCPETFQIIAAGADGDFGTSNPVAFPTPPTDTTLWPSGYTLYGVTDTVNAKGHQDNITNFASGGLLDAAEALKNN
jgi:prepilin-type N-terminal cleavage/methylation domain-containing protein